MQWKLFGSVFYLPKMVVILAATVIGAGCVFGGYYLLRKADAAVTWEVTAAINGTAPVMTTGEITETAETAETTVTPRKSAWRIYIVGAVKQPGFYTLEEGALLYDAVAAAGGLLPVAEAETLNLAQELQDNLMIHILTKQERLQQGRSSSLVLIKNNVEISGGQSSAMVTGEEKININSADKETLMELPGIGEAKAESIIAYREENGPFQSIEDIMLVSGIKESGFAKIKDRITT